MTMIRRRLMLVIGAVLLIEGWGVTRFADEPQQAFNNGAIYGIGVFSMVLGAGYIGYVVLRPTNRE